MQFLLYGLQSVVSDYPKKDLLSGDEKFVEKLSQNLEEFYVKKKNITCSKWENVTKNFSKFWHLKQDLVSTQ